MHAYCDNDNINNAYTQVIALTYTSINLSSAVIIDSIDYSNIIKEAVK